MSRFKNSPVLPRRGASESFRPASPAVVTQPSPSWVGKATFSPSSAPLRRPSLPPAPQGPAERVGMMALCVFIFSLVALVNETTL